MHITMPSFERTVLLLVLVFVAAVHVGLLPKALTISDVQPAMKQIGDVIGELDRRLKALEPAAPVKAEAKK